MLDEPPVSVQVAPAKAVGVQQLTRLSLKPGCQIQERET